MSEYSKYYVKELQESIQAKDAEIDRLRGELVEKEKDLNGWSKLTIDTLRIDRDYLKEQLAATKKELDAEKGNSYQYIQLYELTRKELEEAREWICTKAMCPKEYKRKELYAWCTPDCEVDEVTCKDAYDRWKAQEVKE